MRPQAIQRQADEALAVVQMAREAVAAGRAADQTLAAYFRANRQYGSRDRRFFSAVTFAYFRWKGWVDRIANTRVALAAACWLDGETAYPALAHWAERPLELAPELSLGERARSLAAWQKWDHVPTARELFSDWTFDELLSDGADDFVDRIATAFQHRPPLWLRCRAGRQEDVIRHLDKAGFHSAPDARVPNALRVEGTPSAEILRPLLHRYAEIQDIASQVVGQICAPRPGERWWDVCAGAGGKTLHLLDTLNGKGNALCTDIRESALDELIRRARTAGFPNFSTQSVSDDPTTWNITETFDGILIDAPCSGVGTWGRAPDARWRTPHEQLQRHHQRQLALLRRAIKQLKPGGRLIYAVCSLTKTETVDVIAAAQSSEPSIKLAPITCSMVPGIKSSCCIYPHLGPGIGMWVSSLKNNTNA